MGGNVVSALVGVTAARFVPIPYPAVGVAVGGAILAMSLLRCLHHPVGLPRDGRDRRPCGAGRRLRVPVCAGGDQPRLS
ncbi:HPP family protein [Sphingomonas aerolata]|uniref:HPP family protein n=1 Tax=Sphingomonas aerolata TaxID=185951 RepID=UPI002FE03B74